MLVFLAQQFWFFIYMVYTAEGKKLSFVINDFMFSCCFHVFLNNFFVPYGWKISRVRVKFLTSNQFEQIGTLYQSSNNYPDVDTVTRSANFYFLFEGDSYCFRNRIYLFLFPQKSFHFRILLLIC